MDLLCLHVGTNVGFWPGGVSCVLCLVFSSEGLESLAFAWFAAGGPSCGVEVLMYVLALAGLNSKKVLSDRHLCVCPSLLICYLQILNPLEHNEISRITSEATVFWDMTTCSLVDTC